MSLELLQHWIHAYGYFALFGSLMFGIVGLPIPDETLLTLSGYLVFKGEFALIPTLCCAFLGSISGISLSYAIGRSGGYYVLRKYGPRFGVTAERIQSADRWFERVGKWMIMIGYFIPGVRHVMALVAGSSKMHYPVFAAFAYSGGIIWSTTFILLGYYLGNSWPEVAHHRIVLASIAALIVIGILVFWFTKSKSTRS